MPTATEASSRRLRFWTIHCSVSALPGFILACRTGSAANPLNILAMLLAIGIFIYAYYTISRRSPALSDPKSFEASLLRGILKVRAASVVIAVPCVFDERLMLLVPDTWCGIIAGILFMIPQAEVLTTFLMSIGVGAMLSAMMLGVYGAGLLARTALVRFAPERES